MATTLEGHERLLADRASSLSTIKTVRNDLQANIQHLNKLTNAVSQLKNVVNNMGVKLGERVDAHERFIALQKVRLKSLSLPEQSKQSSSQVKWYKVRRGDSLAKIAKRFGVSVDKLKSLNNLSNNVLQPGQRLRISMDVPALNKTKSNSLKS